MKSNKVKISLGILVVLGLIAVIIYFVCKNEEKKQYSEIDIKYEKINMITNFRLGVSDFDSINPLLTKNKDIVQISQLIFEPLLILTQDYKIENCLAKEWSKISNQIYIVKIKENIKWHNNVELTAEDVKFTIEEIQRNKKSVYLENVKAIEKVEIVDSHTIRLKLNKEIPFFEYQLIFPILSKKQYEGIDMEKYKGIAVGTGKYRIMRMNKETIELTKNESWHKIEEEDSNIKNITISLYKDMGEVYNSFRLGNIDLIHTNNNEYEEYIGSMGYQKKQYPGRKYDFLAFNCQNTVLKDNEVRKAIQKAINKDKIVSTVLENKAIVAYFPLDYGNYIVKDSKWQMEFNQEEANKILKDNGWKREYGIWSKQIGGMTKTLNFDITVNNNDQQRVKVAKEIKEQLEKIGIRITVKKVTDTEYQEILKNHQYEMLLTGVYNGYSPNLSSFFGDGNIANYNNTEINELLKEVNHITNEELQKEKYNQIIKVYQDDMPYIGLYRNQVTVAYGQTVRGDVTPNNYSILYQFSQWYRQ